jgi:hypothetical protein
MTSASPQLDRPNLSINDLKTGHFAGVGDHASGRIEVTVHPAAVGPTLVSVTDQEIEIPPGWPLTDHLLAAAKAGARIYLTQDGLRVAAVVPADVAESLHREPPTEDDDDDPGPLSFVGIGHGGPDLAERSQEILRSELGDGDPQS